MLNQVARASAPFFCFLVVTAPLLGAEPIIAEKPASETTSSRFRSDHAVVKGVVYGLESDGDGLALTSQPLEGEDRAIRRADVKFTVPSDGSIAELSLERLDRKNLVAIVRLYRQCTSEYEFHCLTFIGEWGGHIRNHHVFYESKFYSTRDKDYRILALDGRHKVGSVFAIIGKHRFVAKGEGGIAESIEGVSFFSGCPWPPQGTLTPIRGDVVHSLKSLAE